ncbi:MAG: hypothetical protein ACOYI7_05890 [Candidatus Excrementavichristensenella sp.]|jgi:hypothetical protein
MKQTRKMDTAHRRARRSTMRNRRIAVALALALTAALAFVGGTVAWLIDATGPLINTFTTSGIDITLTETPNLDLKMVPGFDITKDPKATVLAGSEACWLFVKLEKSENFDTFMTYGIAGDWSALGTGYPGVYCRKIETADMGTAYSVLAYDQVTVKDAVTKEQMDVLTPGTYPTLTITAYASQLYKSAGVEFTATEAWGIINTPPSP